MYGISLRDLITIFFRYWKSCAVFTACLIIVLVVYGLIAKKYYESEAVMLIRLGQEQLGSSSVASSSSSVFIARREQEIQNEIRILTSDNTMLAVAKRILGDEKDDQELLLAVRDYLAKHIEASVVRDSNMLHVTFEFPNPLIAQQVLKIVLEEHQKRHIGVFNDSEGQEVLEGNMEKARAEYQAALMALGDFERNNNLFDEKQLTLQLEQRDTLQQTINSLRADYEYNLRKEERLAQTLKDLPQNVTFSTVEVRNNQHERLVSRLSEAYMERENLAARYTKDSRPMRDIDKEIALIEKLAKAKPERIVDTKDTRVSDTWEAINRMYKELAPEIDGQNAQLEEYSKQLDALNKEIANAVQHRREHELLRKDVELTKTAYEKSHAGFLESTLRSTIQQRNLTNISIVEEPAFSEKPVKPKYKLLLLAGIALFLFGNMAILIMRRLLDPTFSSPEQAQNSLSVPVPVAFPYRSRKVHGDGPLSLHNSCLREFQRLYLHLTDKHTPPYQIMISGSRPGEGAMTIAANLAAFAKELQYRSPALVSYGGHQNLPHADHYDHDTVFDNIPVYVRDVNAPPNSEDDFLNELLGRHDMLLIHYHALREMPLLVDLARRVDNVVLVMEAESTSRYIVSYNIDLLRQYGFKAINVVLNKRIFRIPAFIYRMIQ